MLCSILTSSWLQMCRRLKEDLQRKALVHYRSRQSSLQETVNNESPALITFFQTPSRRKVVVDPDGNSFQDGITQTDKEVNVLEGSNVTLSCNYSGTAYSLQWYRQHPGSKLEFLLLILESSKKVQEAKPPHPRLSVELDKQNRHVHLELSSAEVTDSALYYCALEPTVTGNPNTLAEDKVTQSTGDVIAFEGGSVTLGCNFSTSDKENAYLFWYIQDLNSFPKYILRRWKSERLNENAPGFGERFQAHLNTKTNSVPLTIQKLQLSDSAVYYCIAGLKTQ
ncbi:uncharacterized protein LOC118796079 [Megalops cyprinoides]|uniref:uncharacterized protein LOC118796079 n=1 Tax=Megalops cyprinoides TaxID=118141 RepID=UPI001864BF34|nr:uncharacterized protein LOC118796079 [Megalops cyprinoides]